MNNGNDKSRESWIWDAACSIRGAKDASKFKDYTVADDHGDPEELLAKLDEAETQAAALRDQLKAVLAEALLR